MTRFTNALIVIAVIVGLSGRNAMAAPFAGSPSEVTLSPQDSRENAAFTRAIRSKYDLEERAFAIHDADAFLTRFYTTDAISVGEGEGIFIGLEQLRSLYEKDVKDNLVKIESVHTFVNGNAGWDWTDYHVTPENAKTKPFSFVVLYLWAKIDGQWMCKGDFYVSGSFRAAHLKQ